MSITLLFSSVGVIFSEVVMFLGGLGLLPEYAIYCLFVSWGRESLGSFQFPGCAAFNGRFRFPFGVAEVACVVVESFSCVAEEDYFFPLLFGGSSGGSK
jgi:hypothetical protein